MSAGASLLPSGLREYRKTDCLAPRLRYAVELSLEECAVEGLDAMLWETCRSQELQELYWRRGRPPTPEFPHPVTWQQNANKSWHYYGLGVDVISREHGWFNLTKALTFGLTGEALEAVRQARERQKLEWFSRVAAIFVKHGCDWGGNWIKQDLPHVQWGRCRPSPSQLSIDTYNRGGKEAVWKLVRAAA